MRLVPESYKSGITHIEGLSHHQMTRWLVQELTEEKHFLAGSSKDQPVQAILNHAHLLPKKVLGRLKKALCELINDSSLETKDNKQHLLNIIAEIGSSEAKCQLKDIVESETFKNIERELKPVILHSISSLSNQDDKKFWKLVSKEYPAFRSIAWKVLERISKKKTA